MKYYYKARNKKGELFSGTVEAQNYNSILKLLQKRGLIVVEIQEEEKKGISQRSIRIFPERVKGKDLVFLFRQLSSLFGAKVSLINSLTAISRQTKSNLLRETTLKIAQDIEGGISFSEALSRHPKIFSIFVVNMVRTGEAVGNLDKILSYLSDHIERNYKINAKIKGAMYYPAFILGAIGFVIVIMMIFLIPSISEMFDSFGAELPLPTKILLSTSDFFVNYFYIFLIIAPVLISWGLKYFNTPRGFEIKSKAELKIPVLGTLFHNLYLTRLSENLGTLINGGIPLVESLDITESVIGNKLYQEVLSDAKESVKRGETLFESFSKSKTIPSTFSQMIDSGEKSGEVHKTLIHLSSFYNAEAENMVNNLMTLLEPMLIMIMGALVFFIALSVLLPIYSLTSAI